MNDGCFNVPSPLGERDRVRGIFSNYRKGPHAIHRSRIGAPSAMALFIR
jgi:hypothetical protein